MLGERLAELRRHQGLSQQEVANLPRSDTSDGVKTGNAIKVLRHSIRPPSLPVPIT